MMSFHCRMGTVSAVFLCLLVGGMDGVQPKPPSSLNQEDNVQLPPRSSDVILSSFFYGLQHNQVDKLLPGQESNNQPVDIYRTALKKHILERSDVKKISGDSLEGRSDPSSLLSTLIVGLISLASIILKHKVAVLGMLVAALAFPLLLVVGPLY